MSTRYDLSYFPPMPTLAVTFGRSGERPWLGPFQAIIDTGADVTILPEAIVQQLKTVPLDPGELESQWGEVHPVVIYLIDIEVAKQLFPGVVVASDPISDEIILGRNILNKLPLFLDGPQQQTDILDDATANRLRTRREG